MDHYIIKIFNIFDDNQHLGTLLFSAEPVFVSDTDRPMNDNFTEGDTAEFKCHADADPTADVTWYINGKEITGMSLLLTNAAIIFYNQCQLYRLLHMYSVVSVPMWRIILCIQQFMSPC